MDKTIPNRKTNPHDLKNIPINSPALVSAMWTSSWGSKNIQRQMLTQITREKCQWIPTEYVKFRRETKLKFQFSSYSTYHVSVTTITFWELSNDNYFLRIVKLSEVIGYNCSREKLETKLAFHISIYPQFTSELILKP